MSNSRFVRRFSVHFAKLAGLYLVLEVARVSREFGALPYAQQIALLGLGAAFGLAALVPPAVFAAAVNHFDLFGENAPETRRRDWKRLCLIGVGACLLTQLGIPFWEYVLRPMAPEMVREWPQFDAIRLSTPVAVGAFAVIAGVAGAAVGHATQWWSPLGRVAGRWSAAVALMASFAVPLHFIGSLARMEGYPAVWIPLAAPLLPALAACVLVRACGYRVGEVLGLDRRLANWLDEETVNRLVTAVIREDKKEGPAIEQVARTKAELDAALFIRRLRHVAAPAVRVTEAEAQQTIARALASVPVKASKRRPFTLGRLDADQIGEFGLAWTMLLAGSLLLNLMQDASLHLASAMLIGLLGAVAHTCISVRAEALAVATVPAQR